LGGNAWISLRSCVKAISAFLNIIENRSVRAGRVLQSNSVKAVMVDGLDCLKLHAIVPPERLVYTFEFEGMPGHVMLETVTLEEHDGKTKLTVTSLFQTVEDRDGMLKSGMEAGAAETMDRLAELVTKVEIEKE